MNILTEEELKEIENVYSLSFKEVAENYPTIVKLITSHRAIQERNRNLVSENDEQTAEIEKFKNAMVEVYCRSVGINFSVSSYAKYILEECGYDTSELPIE